MISDKSLPDKSFTDRSLQQAIRAFLEDAASKPNTASNCQICGSALKYVSFTFSLADTDGAWEIPFGFCPVCNPTMY
jgi:hypothetical protein